MSGTVLTAHTGKNRNVFPCVLAMYVPCGSTVADVTYGNGNFWRDVEPGRYTVLPSDLLTGVDFGNLPYENGSIDALVLDPPYMHGGDAIKKSLNACYRNQNASHAAVIRLYARGILEAARVLRKGGVLILKSQDEIESGKQRWSHVACMSLLGMFGFTTEDLFIVVQVGAPTGHPAHRTGQKHARKNHSYFLVGRFVG